MRRRQITYLMSGPGHLHYLVPSLFTLRQHHQEHVVVYAYPESIDIVNFIAHDKRLFPLEVQLYVPPFRYRKNDQFIQKLKVMQAVDCETTIYLDADTTIHNRLDSLWECAEGYGFAATQFCHWLSNGRVIRARLERLRGIDGVDQVVLERVLANPYPSLNGGVFACQPTSLTLETWLEWSELAKHIFIADECVLHLLQAYMDSDQFYVLDGGLWNCSHKHMPEREHVKVYHYHGNSNVRPDKSPEAHSYWWALYQHCIAENIGHLAEWRQDVPNEWLDKIETHRLQA